MTATQLKKHIESCIVDIGFYYNGIFGSFCPTNAEGFHCPTIWNGIDKVYTDIDELMTDTSVFGKPLTEIAEQLDLEREFN